MLRKNSTSYFLLFLAAIFILTTAQSCIRIRKKNEVPVTTDGGLYVTSNQGDSWDTLNDVLSVAGGVNLNTADIEDIIFDPNDVDTMYVLTSAQGAFLSLNKGKSWMLIESLGSKVTNLVVHPTDPCTVYASSGNRLLKSTDCLRNFDEVFHTELAARPIGAIAIDPKNHNKIYASTFSQLFQSNDAGNSWNSNGFFGSQITEILTRTVFGTGLVYLVTTEDSIWKSENSGGDWENMEENLTKFKAPVKEEIQFFSFDESGENALIVQGGHRFFRSFNGGADWSRVALISSPSTIHSIAVDPRDAKKIFYTTSNTFYQSLDGGVNWTTKDIPIGPRIAKKLIFDTINPTILYLASWQAPQPKKK